MSEGHTMDRREFIKAGAKGVAGLAAASAVLGTVKPQRVLGANDRIVMAVIGINGRGREHYRQWARIPGVEVKTLCDVDERLFPERVAELEQLQGKKPKTEYDLRRVFEDKDIDAVSIATCDHWHALATIWACQAGKHVFVEKPTSHNIWEGRKMVEAARKYNRVVQVGMQNRSIEGVRRAIEFLHSGKLGEIYMAKGLCYKPRDCIGRGQEAPVPQGLHWDLWLGPAEYRPYNTILVHYKWHWFWDFGCADIGNQGPHQMDIARWGLNKREHPVRIKCVGGKYACDDDQETPNTQLATFEYADGKILQFEVRGWYTNDEAGVRIGNLFYGTEGWMYLNGDKWYTYYGRKNEPGEYYDGAGDVADPMNLAGTGGGAHFVNFIEAVRANDWTKLNADILEGHMSTVLCHLANISYRLGREVVFDGHAERFVGDEQANFYLTRNYRYPYVVPEKV
ncbi:MAG: Gfo/Idh/MocA family oxidoreductase [candidate division KSB1 bacterium]|nr:Gfo/Idh/MocA family oxidoreductase [candidate division KSB1 bacterium]